MNCVLEQIVKYPDKEIDNLFLLARDEGFDSAKESLIQYEKMLMAQLQIDFVGQAVIYNDGCIHGCARARQEGISVIIPVYNGKKYIQRIFESFLNQTIYAGFFELIFVINGDPGNTPDLMRKYAKQAPFTVKILRTPVKNLSLARNIGLAFALRQYFCFVDVDDTVENNYLLALLSVAAPNSIVIAPVHKLERGHLQLDNYGRLLLGNLAHLTKVNIAGYFSNNAGKLAPRYAACGLEFDISLRNGEDVAFWTRFLIRNQLKIISSYRPGYANAYVRHITDNSASRTLESDTEFVRQRIRVINSLASIEITGQTDSSILQQRILAQSSMAVASLLKTANPALLAEIVSNCKSIIAKEFILEEYINKCKLLFDEKNHEIYLALYLARLGSLHEEFFRTGSKKLLQQIDSLSLQILKNYEKLPENSAECWRKKFLDAKLPIFNKSSFGQCEGIAFCHNYPPASDPAAFVTARRMSQISRLHGELIKWRCFTSVMQQRHQDMSFYNAYGKYQCAKIRQVGEPALWNPEAQRKWAQTALKEANKYGASVIYSHALWVGSHLAALEYKRRHPGVKWYAEFSDPLSISTDGKRRSCALDFEAKSRGDFYASLEADVMTNADYLIFANKNQKRLMIEENPFIENTAAIYAKSAAIIFPPVPKGFCNIETANYKLEPGFLNIGYFGSLYKERNLDALVKLLDYYPQIILHLFLLLNPDMLAPSDYPERIRINNVVNYFQGLNLAKRMDLLYLEDTDCGGRINPYLPSKFIDYLATDTPILIKRQPGSPLSSLRHKRLIDYADFDKFYDKWQSTHIVN